MMHDYMTKPNNRMKDYNATVYIYVLNRNINYISIVKNIFSFLLILKWCEDKYYFD